MLQQNACEQLYYAVHSQKGEQLPQREIKQWQLLDGARPLNNHTVRQGAGEAHAASRLWGRHFVQQVMYITLDAQLFRALIRC